MAAKFLVDATYTRADIQDVLGVAVDKRKGDWATGYTKFNGEYFVFATLGGAARTGHDYDNYWDGDDLIWSAKAGSKVSQPQVQELVSGKLPIRVFWREGDRAPFIYAGEGRAKFVGDDSPVRVVWSFDTAEGVAAVTPESLRITWSEGKAKGYTDIFPAGEFDSECFREPRSHSVLSPSNELYGTAKYLLTVTGAVATLDYSAFAEDNTKAGMYLGIAVFEFADEDRSVLRQVYWKSSAKASQTPASPRTQTYEPVTPPPYVPPPPDTPIIRDLFRRKERKGQRVFRTQLRRAYGNRCCITGCAAPDALEAAHLDQHVSSASDVPSNGLLLRRDIHALFDRDLIGISPDGEVFVAEGMIGREQYQKELSGTRISKPEKAFCRTGYLPSELALQNRWEQFKKKWE